MNDLTEYFWSFFILKYWVFLGRFTANQDEYFTYFLKLLYEYFRAFFELLNEYFLWVFLGRFWIFITEYFTGDFGIDLYQALSYNRTKKN